MFHIQAGPKGFSSLQNVLTSFKAHPTSYSMGISRGGVFVGDKARE